jgi:hypothetical protein
MQLGGEAVSAVSETTFNGTLISGASFETLRSEDLLAKRVNAFLRRELNHIRETSAFRRRDETGLSKKYE